MSRVFLSLILIAVLIVIHLTGCANVAPTPSPEPNVRDCPTDAEQAYFRAIGHNATARADLLVQIDEDPALYLDLIESVEQVEAMDPPASVQDIHQDYLSMGDHHRKFAILYVQGIAYLDPDLIDDAADHLSIADAYGPGLSLKTHQFCRPCNC